MDQLPSTSIRWWTDTSLENNTVYSHHCHFLPHFKSNLDAQFTVSLWIGVLLSQHKSLCSEGVFVEIKKRSFLAEFLTGFHTCAITGAESQAILSKVSAKISTFFAANPMIDFRSRCKSDRIYLIDRRVCINFYPVYQNNIVVFNETA